MAEGEPDVAAAPAPVPEQAPVPDAEEVLAVPGDSPEAAADAASKPGLKFPSGPKAAETLEKTFALIKPDAVRAGVADEITNLTELAGFKVVVKKKFLVRMSAWCLRVPAWPDRYPVSRSWRTRQLRADRCGVALLGDAATRGG